VEFDTTGVQIAVGTAEVEFRSRLGEIKAEFTTADGSLVNGSVEERVAVEIGNGGEGETKNAKEKGSTCGFETGDDVFTRRCPRQLEMTIEKSQVKTFGW